MSRLVIDGDSIAYAAAFASQRTCHELVCKEGVKIDLGECSLTAAKAAAQGYTDVVKVHKYYNLYPVENALHGVKLKLLQIFEACGSDEYKLFLTSQDGSNFRIQHAKTLPYKGNRKEKDRPIHLGACRKYMVDYWNAQIVHGEEAEDACGKSNGEGVIIVHIDKDLNNLVGRHYNYDKNEFYDITPKQAYYNFYMQLLTGDLSVDNIPGLKWFCNGPLNVLGKPKKTGWGPVSLTPILEGCETKEEMLAACKQFYETNKKDDSPDFNTVYKEIGPLLWIRRK